jgi:Tfp pilus assembly protein PilF
MIHLDNSTKRRGLIGVIVANLTAIALCQSLWADEPAADYEMSYIANQAQGSLVAKGRYQRAIDGLAGASDDPLAKYLNLCVAQVMAGQNRNARRSCNRAVDLSEQAARSAPADLREEHYRKLAIALSNRGVLRAIRGQQGAEDDFRQAIQSPVQSNIAARNLARFNGTNEDALVVAAAPAGD